MTGCGDELDSSIDAVSALFLVDFLISSFAIRHIMVRDGLLSSNSRILPTSTRRRDGRSDSVITTGRPSFCLLIHARLDIFPKVPHPQNWGS
jgi:hypothetical protein